MTIDHQTLSESRPELPSLTSWDDVRDYGRDRKIHTVRVSFVDRLGHWRGKRVPFEHFLATVGVIGIGSGLLVSDVASDNIYETPYANIDNGYPDLHVRPRPDDVFPVGWALGELYCFANPTDHHGQPAPVAPATILESVLSSLDADRTEIGVQLGVTCRLMTDEAAIISPDSSWADSFLTEVVAGLEGSGIRVEGCSADGNAGTVTIWFRPAAPADAARWAVVAKGVLKELAQREGKVASFMTRPPAARRAAELRIAISLFDPLRVDTAAATLRIREARALLQPSINAFKASVPTITVDEAGTLHLSGVSSEADPYAAIALALCAVHRHSGATDGGREAPSELRAAAAALAASKWTLEALGREYIENAVPLLSHEADLFQQEVTEYEVARYWSLA